MPIDFDLETIEITDNLKQVEGYLDCEKIIIHNIKKHLEKGFDEENIIAYLKKLSVFLNRKIDANQGKADCSNYRYAAGFVNTLLKMPY
jgi:hypothetical protein